MFIFVMIFYGLAYYFFESVFNMVADITGWYRVFKTDEKKKLRGWCSVYMFLLGFIFAIGLWGLYFIPYFKTGSIWVVVLYMIITGLHITINELLFGYILNIKLKLNLWDYSREFLNFRGQISLIRAIGWVLLGMPIWFINFTLYNLLF